MSDIKVGDVVTLKSGGSRMTISIVRDQNEGCPEAVVLWQEEGHPEIYRDFVPVDCLVKCDDQA